MIDSQNSETQNTSYPHKENLLNLHRVNLQKVFGKNSLINEVDGVLKVDTKLKDGRLCPGGQCVHVDLEAGRNNKYVARELTIDGAQLTRIFGNKFFFIVPEEHKKLSNIFHDIKGKFTDIKFMLKDTEQYELFSHFMKKFTGTKAFPYGIQLVSLDDADGLAGLFHEIGHTRDERPSEINEIDFFQVQQYLFNNRHNYEEKKLASIKESAENILDYEMFANKIAIKAIELLKTQGFDLFKSDKDLSKVKEFFSLMTRIRFYKSSKFFELVSKNRIEEILKF